MANCYNLISPDESLYPSIFGLQYATANALDGEVVYVSGTPYKSYTLKRQQQVFIKNFDSLNFLSSDDNGSFELSDEGGSINWSIPSFIFNGVEKITTIPDIDVTPADIDYFECNEFYCISTSQSLANQYSNFVDFLNSVFESNNISLSAKMTNASDFSIGMEAFALLISENDSISFQLIKVWDSGNKTATYNVTITNGSAEIEYVEQAITQNSYSIVTTDNFYIEQNETKLYTIFDAEVVYQAWANSIVNANCGSGCLNVNNPCQNKSFLYSMFFYIGIEGLTIYNEKDYTAKFDELLLALTEKITALSITDNSGESDIVLNSVIDGAVLGLSKNIYFYSLKELYGLDCCNKSIYEIINYINIIKVIEWNNVSQFLSLETINCLEFKLNEVSVCSDLEAGDFNEDYNIDFY